jgi:hypothetical protein
MPAALYDNLLDAAQVPPALGLKRYVVRESLIDGRVSRIRLPRVSSSFPRSAVAYPLQHSRTQGGTR